ncbi:hypothetical protein [Anaerobutyricum hallii]|uniref:Uncharacterized protein n=1 Tax=Anaerobutyricum hallii TaxID=39488 RepID=A0A374NA11_9FIRM|nr:hypothetical protein [Anaerobutyricum hallii]RGI80585.1 hypothetical protein DXD91_13285 [Anaerobutyricum hallii]
MITLEEKEVWIRRYYPFCESYMKMALADRNKIPQLEIRLDKVHIRIIPSSISVLANLKKMMKNPCYVPFYSL